jgi:trehalose-phosphatase
MHVPSALPVTPALAQRLSGSPLVLLLDVDGTLSPIAPRPEHAVVPPETTRVLSDLAALPTVHAAIVSGRSAADARRLVGVDGVWLIGNHGMEVAEPSGPPQVRADVARYESVIAEAAARAEQIARRCDGIVLENKRWTLSVHFRLAAEDSLPAVLHDIKTLAAELGLRVTHGKKVLELRPPVHVDKGVAAVALARALGAMQPIASILCAGDDVTDEDAFRAVRAAHPSAVTVRVGIDGYATAETAAEFSLPDTASMHELLSWVLASRNGSQRLTSSV